MRFYPAVLALALFACGGCQAPVVPVGPAPGPTPVNPVPDQPPVVSGSDITDEQYASIDDEQPGADGAPRVGTPESKIVPSLGEPFRKTTTGGFTIYVYTFKNSPAVAWLMVSGGKVVRKSRLG